MENKNGKLSLQTPRRMINWWMRWEDLNWPNGDILDKIKRRAEAAAKAEVTTAILFGAHFRWDYLPYFTILHDYIATVAEELHKHGIELYDRHSVNLIHRYDTVEEMRHVMLHSGPHLPFSPSREAAACWEYQGKRLNDWRMIDVTNGKPLYYPQYASEGFCYNNPDYIDAYCSYAKRLLADTGIDGLAAEDSVHYMHYLSCACPHCKAEFKRRTGLELPSHEDRGFWGNWANPAWLAWIDMRYDTGKVFFEKLTKVMPKDFPLITCGANSASYGATGKANDASIFAKGGSNYVHSEMSGNTPPYKHDPVTWNSPLLDRMVAFSHHQTVARENGIRSFSTGYGFTEPSANVIWAVNKVLDTDCLFSTLKARLGLPDHMLAELPEEPAIIQNAFTFEKAHPELFGGEQIAQVGVYFSSETRDHTLFGNLAKGYYKDYRSALQVLFAAGISADTVLNFPKDSAKYPVIALPSVAAMTAKEECAMRKYLANGGKILVCGPSPLAECKNKWELPTSPAIDTPIDFFDTIAHGVSHKYADWITQTVLPESSEASEWKQVGEGIFYTPHRISDGKISEGFLALCRRYGKQLPVEITFSKGYLTTMFEDSEGITVHFLAEDYDTDIDHKLDEMRFHRSRVNLITKVTPIKVDEKLTIRSKLNAEVFVPFTEERATVVQKDGEYEITLPKDTFYAIVKLRA